eukprot:TRINITY_DN13254_c0_g1_i3.p3 TRINITY_DN13254_c0_g1~~TRINITY_DN13254_c0_g1_i3.p3  ORF type:complete len:125 (+),score=23.16 TRINITY_DN13254_c0_g1_i3:75-449(+)
MFFFFNDTATTEIYTRSIVGSVRCVQETGPILVQQENTTVQQAEAVQTIAYPVMSTTFVFQKVYLQNQELALTDILVLPVQFIHSQKQTIVKRITIVLLGLKMSVLQKLILTALSQELLNQETA